jgi:hypothetical protein
MRSIAATCEISIDRLGGQTLVGEVTTERLQNDAKIFHCDMSLLVVLTSCKSCNLGLDPDQETDAEPTSMSAGEHARTACRRLGRLAALQSPGRVGPNR